MACLCFPHPTITLANPNGQHLSLIFSMGQTRGCIPLCEGGVIIIPILQGDVIISPIDTTNKWLCWNVNPGIPDSRNPTVLLTPWGTSWPFFPALLLVVSLTDPFLMSPSCFG